MSELALLDDTSQPWHRRQGETPQAHHAFGIYLHLPPPRTIRAAAEVQATTLRRKLETTYVMFKGWSRKHDWPGRADAYDRYIDRLQIQARETERQRIDREQMAEARFLRSAAMARFTGGRDAQGEPIVAIDWNDLDSGEALRVWNSGVMAERTAAGMSLAGQMSMVPLSQAKRVIEDLVQCAVEHLPEDRLQSFLERVQAIVEANG